LKDWSNDFSTYIPKAAKLGFEVIEINTPGLLQLSAKEVVDLKKLADDNNIEITYSLGLGAQHNLSSPDETVRKNGVKFVSDILKQVSLAKGKVLSGIIYGSWKDHPDNAYHSRPEAFQNSVKSIQQIIKVAEDLDITYCVEPVNRFENFLLNTAEQAVELCRAVDSPNIKVLLDSFHMCIEEEGMAVAIETAGSYLAHMHIAENHRRPVGLGGLINWDEVFNALRKVGYKGILVLEHFCIPGGSIGQDVGVLRDLVPDISEEGIDRDNRKALAFVKEKLKR
jgi:D-psicose/D-tagatose/L-ribulose 3-epimerase